MGGNCCGSKSKKHSRLLPTLISSDLPIDTTLQYSDSHYFKARQVIYYNRLLLEESIQDPPSPPESWETFHIIGTGSFGRVLFGVNTQSGRSLAIKEIPLIGLSNLSSVCEEFNILSQLHHPNIVQCLGFQLKSEFLLIFMEHLSGGTIQTLLHKIGPFSESLIKNCTKQILKGLEYLHYHNIVHRDLKGNNILLTGEQECKLADFGSAKNILGIEVTASVTGTFNWMAPEVINESGHGRFADIWSLGCLIIEMATGRPPWSEYTNMEIVNAVLYSEEIPNLPNGYSDCLKSFIQPCFARNPYKRPNVFELLLHPFVNSP